ncbi:TLC domain-containing protein [Actinidia chinensis var. chinensis]|uniref:TLC domain-containing protein n=1 Tax=Actinidia chinensis var. chinensis TaxID=1590841 RepID=A0A2R6RFH5_ACTCC|nr:TLC domain-containing protein [Actinidia chinensis var. chinensis]
METLRLLTLPSFFLMFATLYLLGYTIIFRKWAGLSRPEASSCFLSLAHGTPAVLLATFSLLHPNLPSNFASPNTPFQNTVLEFSMAYFFTDTFHYLLFVPTDPLFIAHHAATLYVFFTCRYIVHHGAFPILVLLILAEVTSACQNAWSLAGFCRLDSPGSARVHESLSPLFYGFYSVVRGILGPVFVYKMGFFYLSGVNGIPQWAWVSWMGVIVSAILLSILWVLNLWMGLWRERSKKRKMKKLG